MATSGTTTFAETKLEIIQDAFHLLSVYGEGMSLSAFEEQQASNMLNKMLKAWNAKGLHLWSRNEGVLFLSQYQYKYSIKGSAHATTIDDLITIKLTSDHAIGDTVLNVSSITGIDGSDKIGIVLEDKSIFWTIVLSGAALTLTIQDALPTAATTGGIIYTYTNEITRPLNIKPIARAVNGFDSGATSTLTEIPFELIPYDDFMAIPTKTINATTISMGTYNPNRLTGDFYVFPRPSDCSYRVYFTYEKSIEDILDSGDDVDIPSEWLECVTWQLALRLATAHGRITALTAIAPIASQMLSDLLSWDSEHQYIDLEPGCN